MELLARLIAGEVALPSPIWMSQAVAVQIWRLVFDGAARAAELRDVGWPGIYMILGSLSLGMRPAVDEAAVKRLQVAIGRQRNASTGLGPAFKEKLKLRARDPELKGMSLEEATTHLYLTLDREPFNFTFKQASGGGGGGGGGGSGGAEQASPAPAPSPPPRLDIRTRTLEVQLELMALASRRHLQRQGQPLTTWHERAGELPLDVLRQIDAHVRLVSLPRVRREQTFELQCIRLRGEVDRLRAEVENLKLAVAASELEPQRQVRRFQYAQDQAAAKLQAASEAQERMRKEYMLQIKEQRAAHAFEVNQLLGEQRGERAQAMETTTRLEGLISDLEKQLRSAHAAMRKGGQMAAKTQEQLEDELQRVKEGRVWSAVREEHVTRVGACASRRSATSSRPR